MFAFVVIKIHDDRSEGLGRRAIVSLVISASGGKLSRAQAERTWDKTIHPFGKRCGLLTGYVKSQEGTSKRTAAGSAELQRDWHLVCDEMFRRVKERAAKVLQDPELVQNMLPSLNANLDEECVHAMGKNAPIVGSADKSKHDNQNSTSSQVPCCQPVFVLCDLTIKHLAITRTPWVQIACLYE